jgi:hypothetical protein
MINFKIKNFIKIGNILSETNPRERSEEILDAFQFQDDDFFDFQNGEDFDYN